MTVEIILCGAFLHLIILSMARVSTAMKIGGAGIPFCDRNRGANSGVIKFYSVVISAGNSGVQKVPVLRRRM